MFFFVEGFTSITPHLIGGVVAGAIANRRGLSTSTFVIFGLLMPLFASVVAISVKSPRRSVSRKAAS